MHAGNKKVIMLEKRLSRGFPRILHLQATLALNIAYRNFQVVEILLQLGVLLRHFLILAFPLITRRLKGLHFALVMAGFNVGLAEPITTSEISNCSPTIKRGSKENHTSQLSPW